MKIAINGFGRIGRATFKNVIESKKLEVMVINDLTDIKTLAHLLKYDSVYGIYEKDVSFTKDSLIIDGKKYKVLAEKDPRELPWKALGIDIVLECTGFFTDYDGAKKHLEAGAKKVIISAPSKSPEIKTFITGVNEEKYSPQADNVISNASCTTNCLAPIVKILNDNFGVKKGLMTTIHAYTSTQKIVDGPHKDLRRARAAAINIIPTTTGAAATVTKTIPELEGKLDGLALRIPLACVSVVDFVSHLKKEVTAEVVNAAFEKEAKGKFKGILDVTRQPLVSSDFIKNPYLAVVDLALTKVEEGNLVKVIAWYDNEWGYSVGLVKMAEYVASKL